MTESGVRGVDIPARIGLTHVLGVTDNGIGPQMSRVTLQSTAAQIITLLGALPSGLGFSTRALLYADLAHGANVQATVWADPTDAYNGVYSKVGASGTGSWTLVAPLPLGQIALGTTAFVNDPNDAEITITGPQNSRVLNLTLFRGSKIWGTANAPPSVVVGNDGDFAIDSVTYAIYGPKANGVWPAPSMTAAASAAAAAASAATAVAAATGIVGGTVTISRVASIAALRLIAPTTSYDALVENYYSGVSGGGGWFTAKTGASAGTYVDDGGYTILPTGGNGSACWQRVKTGPVYFHHFGAYTDGTHPTETKAAIDKALAYGLAGRQPFRAVQFSILYSGGAIPVAADV